MSSISIASKQERRQDWSVKLEQECPFSGELGFILEVVFTLILFINLESFILDLFMLGFILLLSSIDLLNLLLDEEKEEF